MLLKPEVAIPDSKMLKVSAEYFILLLCFLGFCKIIVTVIVLPIFNDF